MDTVSKVALGASIEESTVTIGVGKDDYLAMLERCVNELGITYLDSAESYLASETTIGEWISQPGNRDRVTIGSKFSYPYTSILGQPLGVPFTQPDIIGACDRALGQMQTDHLDIFWMHWPDPKGFDWDQVMGAFAELKAAGKIRYSGLCNVYSPQTLSDVVALSDEKGYPRPDFLQNEFHLIYAEAMQPVVARANELGIDYVAYSPLAGGLLTGKYDFAATDPKGEGAIPEGSRWSVWKGAYPLPSYWNKKLSDRMTRFQARAQELGISVAALAMSWVFNHPGIRTTITGPRKPYHLDDIQRAMNFVMNEALFNELAELFRGVDASLEDYDLDFNDFSNTNS